MKRYEKGGARKAQQIFGRSPRNVTQELLSEGVSSPRRHLDQQNFSRLFFLLRHLYFCFTLSPAAVLPPNHLMRELENFVSSDFALDDLPQ